MVNRVVISLVHHQNPFTPFSKFHTPFLLTLLLSWVCFCCTLRALCVADLELIFFYTALSDHKRAKPDSFRGQTDGPDTCCRLVHPGKFTTSGLFAQMHTIHYCLLTIMYTMCITCMWPILNSPRNKSPSWRRKPGRWGGNQSQPKIVMQLELFEEKKRPDAGALSSWLPMCQQPPMILDVQHLSVEVFL